MRWLGEHAVVLGAGMAGLLTARVLVDAYEQVTVVERDALPATGRPGDGRRGVPQGRHAHAFMARGTQVVDELFPGLVGELVADGAVLVDPLTEFRMRIGGRLLRPVPIGAPAVQASRPFLEAHVRDRVRALGVELVDGCDVVGLLPGAGGERITGVRVLRHAPGSAEETLPADLVVDAMGRGGRTPSWLAELGYQRPAMDEPKVDVAYASRYLRLPDDAHRRLEKIIGVGPVPGHPRGAIMVAVENGRRVVTLVGLGPAHRPPTDPGGFTAFATTVLPPDVLDALAAAEPVGSIAGYRYPSYQRRHYERLRRFPAGLLVTGDAVCSFNPIYAQGMTVAALQADALRECLAAGRDGLARRFFRASARIVADPWRAAVGADLALPEVPGRRPPMFRVTNAYTARVLAAAETDDVVSRQFGRVLGMLDPGSALLRPAILRRVLRPRAPEPGLVPPSAPAHAHQAG